MSYPGLPTHPGHAVAKQQMTSFGGMIMADVDGGAAGGKTVVEVTVDRQCSVVLDKLLIAIATQFCLAHKWNVYLR